MKKNHALIFYGLLVAVNIYSAVINWPNPFCLLSIVFAVWMGWYAFRLIKPKQ